MSRPLKGGVACFSKQLDTVAKGRPLCLRAVAATCLLIEEAEKLTMGQPTTVRSPHPVSTLLETKGHLWLSQNRILPCQATLLDSPQISLKPCQTSNPATLLPEATWPVPHACLEVIDQVYPNRKDHQSAPLSNAEEEWWVDGSHFLHNGQGRAGYAVVCPCRRTQGPRGGHQSPWLKRQK